MVVEGRGGGEEERETPGVETIGQESISLVASLVGGANRAASSHTAVCRPHHCYRETGSIIY